MRRQSQPWTWLVVAIAGWIQRDQQAAIVCVFGHDEIAYRWIDFLRSTRGEFVCRKGLVGFTPLAGKRDLVLTPASPRCRHVFGGIADREHCYRIESFGNPVRFARFDDIESRHLMNVEAKQRRLHDELRHSEADIVVPVSVRFVAARKPELRRR